MKHWSEPGHGGADIEKAGWRRSTEPGDAFYSARKQKQFDGWAALREAFLLPGERKIIGATIGVWLSTDGSQMIVVDLAHKTKEGAPRTEWMPDPEEPLTERTYLLRVGVMYSEALTAYRAAHRMELRREAMKRHGLRDPGAI